MKKIIKSTEPLYQVSQAAMFAATINHFIGSITSETEEQRELFTKILRFSLGVLVPKQIKTDQEKAQAFYVGFMAKATDMLELEAEMLTMLKPVLDAKLFNDFAGIDYSRAVKDEEYIRLIAETVYPCIRNAGVTDLRKAFDEIDDLNFMVEEETA